MFICGIIILTRGDEMLLEEYLKNNNKNIHKMHIISGIPETTVRNINKREMERWNMKYFDAIAQTVGKPKIQVIQELEVLEKKIGLKEPTLIGKYNLENRRYIGNKNKLLNWIEKLVLDNTEGKSFFDVFAGTGVVTKKFIDKYDKFYINDFLFSNKVIYNAFFGNEKFDADTLYKLQDKYQGIIKRKYDDEYFSFNYGGKFFSKNDSKIIGEIRTLIEKNKKINQREKDILLSSLLYSVDKIANTVGHYDAYRKKVELKDRFVFELINVEKNNKSIEIYREDSNDLAPKIKADIAFIDPPYNSRQYSRFYHLLEMITKWNKPELEGVAMKPPAENMSEYSRATASSVFDDLIYKLNVKYIVVTYNNTYFSKSKSSKNKITHDEILESLNKVGNTKIFEKPFKFFNAGKSNLNNHKEFLFITEVNNDK